MKKKNKKPFIYMLIILLIVVGIWTGIQFYNFYKVPGFPIEEEYQLFADVIENVKVRDEIDMSVIMGPEGIFFGRLVSGEKQAHGIEVENPFDFPLQTEVIITGNLASLVTHNIPKQIQPGEVKKATLTVTIPEGAIIGEYEANLTILFNQ